MEPVFTVQFFFGDILDHVQKLLCHEALEFAERLLLKNRAYLFLFCGCALAENQLSNFFKQGCRRISQVSLQFFLALVVRELRKPIVRKLQKLRHFLINVCSVRRRGQFLASQQLGNIGLRNISGGRQIFLLKPQFIQSPFNHKANVHNAPPLGLTRQVNH